MTIGTFLTKIANTLNQPHMQETQLRVLTIESPSYEDENIPMHSYYGIADMSCPIYNLKAPTDSAPRKEFTAAYLARRNNDLRWQGAALAWITDFAAMDGLIDEKRVLNCSLNWEAIKSENWAKDIKHRYELHDLAAQVRDLALIMGISFHDAYIWALLEESQIGSAYWIKRALKPLNVEDSLRERKRTQRRTYRAAAKRRAQRRRGDRQAKKFATRIYYTLLCFGSPQCHYTIGRDPQGFALVNHNRTDGVSTTP